MTNWSAFSRQLRCWLCSTGTYSFIHLWLYGYISISPLSQSMLNGALDRQLQCSSIISLSLNATSIAHNHHTNSCPPYWLCSIVGCPSLRHLHLHLHLRSQRIRKMIRIQTIQTIQTIQRIQRIQRMGVELQVQVQVKMAPIFRPKQQVQLVHLVHLVQVQVQTQLYLMFYSRKFCQGSELTLFCHMSVHRMGLLYVIKLGLGKIQKLGIRTKLGFNPI